MRKTKIMATIGPSSKEEVVLEEMILNGMNIARFNMKYSSLDFCLDIIEKINKIDKKLHTTTSILMDLKGPTITIDKFIDGSAFFKEKDKIRIYMKKILGDNTKFSVSYEGLINDVKTNTIIKINNGLVELKVLEKNDDSIICEVIHGGYVKNNERIDVINCRLNLPFISNEDKKSIEFADKNNIDFLALSYVSSLDDVLLINDKLIELNNDHIAIFPKIEKISAVDELDEIIKVSDGIIISRDDLAVEIPIERIPGIQKQIIHKCHLQAKASIVSAEMKSSNDQEIIPTKAEVNDLAVAVLDGVDTVMLSGETTIGKYPVGTITMMNKIIESSEENMNYLELLDKAMRTERQDITGIIAYSVVECSNRLKSLAIVTPTMSGYTSKKISRFRPNCPIIAPTPSIETAKSLGIYYGIYPIVINEIKSFDAMLKLSKEIIVKKIDYQEKDKIIITGGYPFREVNHTNFMKIEEL